jgi:prepilin-type N-terminal cleavage/methylation domain-containing protein
MHISIGKPATEHQRGDTLVEVLIAIAVISLNLAGAYVTTNRSLTATRAAQERGNALKLAESQIEQLKGIVASDPTEVFGGAAPSPFCIDLAGDAVPASSGSCVVNTSGAPAAAGVQPRFTISIQRTGNNFVLTETWFNAGGKQTDQLQLRYRLYQ